MQISIKIKVWEWQKQKSKIKSKQTNKCTEQIHFRLARAINRRYFYSPISYLVKSEHMSNREL